MAVLCPSMTYTCRDGLRRTPNPRFPILRSICSLRSGWELQKSWALQECEGRSPTCRIEKNLSASSLKKVPRMSHEPSMISTLREFPTHSHFSRSQNKCLLSLLIPTSILFSFIVIMCLLPKIAYTFTVLNSIYLLRVVCCRRIFTNLTLAQLYGA